MQFCSSLHATHSPCLGVKIERFADIPRQRRRPSRSLLLANDQQFRPRFVADGLVFCRAAGTKHQCVPQCSQAARQLSAQRPHHAFPWHLGTRLLMPGSTKSRLRGSLLRCHGQGYTGVLRHTGLARTPDLRLADTNRELAFDFQRHLGHGHKAVPD